MVGKKPTIADLRALKGQGQRTMLRIFTLDEAEAAEQSGIDIVSLPPELLTHPRYRDVAPSLFSMTGMTHLEYGTRDDYRRFAVRMLEAGGDAVYCSGGLDYRALSGRGPYPSCGACRACTIARDLDGWL